MLARKNRSRSVSRHKCSINVVRKSHWSTFFPLQSEDVLPSTSSVEDVLQRLLLRNSKDLQLRGKTVSMDNARGQNEQLRSRASRQQTRRCTRLSVRTSNLGNSLISGNGVESSDVKRKPRDVASLDSYEGLKSAWQGYAQDLLTLCQENAMRTKGGMSPISPAQSRQNILPCSSSLKRGPKKSLERSLAMADFSGCQIKILDSKCVSEVGFEGLVLHESRGALHILPLPRNHRSSQLCHASKRLRIIPKKGRRFQADVLTSSGRCTVIWHGNGLIDRERLTAFRASMPNRCRGLERESGRMLRNTCVDS